MEFDLKGVHMGRYELILKLDGFLWLTIISNSLLTPKRAMERLNNPDNQKSQVNFVGRCSGQLLLLVSLEGNAAVGC